MKGEIAQALMNAKYVNEVVGVGPKPTKRLLSFGSGTYDCSAICICEYGNQ